MPRCYFNRYVIAMLCSTLGSELQAEVELKLLPWSAGDQGNQSSHLTDDPMTQAASRFGIDVHHPPHPYLVTAYANRQFFYAFYNNASAIPNDRAYLVQTVKKTEENYIDETSPATRSELFKVEAFKTTAGRLKRPDQHFGQYSLGPYQKRVITKQYEIGIATIPDTSQTASWPFNPSKLFHVVQEFSGDDRIFGEVQFEDSVRWQTIVTFDSSGSYDFQCEQLRLHNYCSVGEMPKPQAAGLSNATLTPGLGVHGIVVGQSDENSVRKNLGEPLAIERPTTSSNNFVYPQLTCCFNALGVLRSIVTNPEFSGATGEGIRLGATREAVRIAYGSPLESNKNAWIYSGAIFWFGSSNQTVERIVIWRHPDTVLLGESREPTATR